MDKIWYRNPSKSEVIGRCGGDEKTNDHAEATKVERYKNEIYGYFYRTPVWLSTSPTETLTHWYQVRCLIQTPVLVKQGQILTGKVLLRCNKR